MGRLDAPRLCGQGRQSGRARRTRPSSPVVLLTLRLVAGNQGEL